MEDLVITDIFQVYHIFEHDLGLTPTLSEQVFDTNYDGIDAKLENNMFMHKSETVFHWDQKTCRFEIYDCLVGTRIISSFFRKLSVSPTMRSLLTR